MQKRKKEVGVGPRRTKTWGTREFTAIVTLCINTAKRQQSPIVRKWPSSQRSLNYPNKVISNYIYRLSKHSNCKPLCRWPTFYRPRKQKEKACWYLKRSPLAQPENNRRPLFNTLLFDHISKTIYTLSSSRWNGYLTSSRKRRTRKRRKTNASFWFASAMENDNKDRR